MSYLKKSDLIDVFDEVYYNLNDAKKAKVYWSDDFSKSVDPINFILENDNVKEFIISPFKYNQPKMYAQLVNAEFFYAIRKTKYPGIMSDITAFGVVVNNNVFYIRHSNGGYEKEGDNIIINKSILPQEILESWFFRTESWYQAEESTISIFKSRLPNYTRILLGLVLYGDEYNDKNKKKEYAFLENKFHKKVSNLTNDFECEETDYVELRCLFDTRPSEDYSCSGFQIFSLEFEGQEKPAFYIVPKANVFEIKRLKNVVDAIDSYAAHIFSGSDKEFDFNPYMEEF